MKSMLLNFASQVRGSYWYIPLLMSLTAVLLGILTLRLDHLFVLEWLKKGEWFYISNLEGSRTILSTIATSMITVAGVTFSMTIVAVAFAASQVGPRLTSNFMRDRGNQITLGIFIATFLFCIFILLALTNIDKNGVSELDGLVMIPQISLLVAILLTISSIIVLIYFIHHIPESINMSNVIASVAEELNRQVSCQFPINIGKDSAKKIIDVSKVYPQHKTVVAKTKGYIRILDAESLMEIATKNDLIIKLEVRTGAFIIEQTPLLTIYSSKKIDNDLSKQCVDVFVMGQQRNQEQDILFLLDEILEIIARALSPGVNDPFTAVTCLDWLKSSLQKLSKTNQPEAHRYDKKDKLRLITKPIMFAEFCEHTFSRIQSYICQDTIATFHMMKMIISLHNNIDNHEHKLILRSYATSLKNAAAENLVVEEDKKKLFNMYDNYFN